jgi:hypothetical protein
MFLTAKQEHMKDIGQIALDLLVAYGRLSKPGLTTRYFVGAKVFA